MIFTELVLVISPIINVDDAFKLRLEYDRKSIDQINAEDVR
jgi:hypothetical protein